MFASLTAQALLDALDGIAYIVDEDGRIVAVGRNGWDDFARANGGEAIAGSSVIGRSLFEFVAGPEVQEHLRGVLRRLTSGPYRAWVMPYRCDAPGVMRNMRLSITPLRAAGQSWHLFHSVALSTEHRPPIELFDFAARAARHLETQSWPIIIMCSWCQTVRHPDACEWLTPERYYASGAASQVRITHGICETCVTKLDADAS